MFNSIPKLLIGIAWTAVLSAPTAADHVRQVQCTAKRAPAVLIGEDECSWLWYRDIYLQLSQEYRNNWDAWLVRKLRGQELVYEITGNIANVTDLAENLLGKATFATVLGDTTVDLAALWVTSMPIDDDTATQISRDWSVRVTEAFWATSKAIIIGAEATFPYDDFLRLANDFGFLVNEMRITRWRYTEIVINAYLLQYFIDGRGGADAAEAFGLKSNDSRRKVYDSIYEKYKSKTKILGIYDQGYDKNIVEDAVKGMIEVVSRLGNERLVLDAGSVPAQFPQTRSGTLSFSDALRVLADKSGSDRHSSLTNLEPKLDAPLGTKDIAALAGPSWDQYYESNIRVLRPTWPPLMSVQGVLDIIGPLKKQQRSSLLQSLYPYLQSNISPSGIAKLAGDVDSDFYRRLVLKSYRKGASSISVQESMQLLAGTSGSDRYEIIRILESRLPYIVQPNDVVKIASNPDISYYAKSVARLAKHLPIRIGVAGYENLLGNTKGNRRKTLEKNIMTRVETIGP